MIPEEFDSFFVGVSLSFLLDCFLSLAADMITLEIDSIY